MSPLQTSPKNSMLDSNWSSIDEIFDHALDLEPGQRESYVLDATKDRPDLRKAVLELLSLNKESDQFLETPVMEGASAIVFDAYNAEENGSPEEIGPYKILSKLGEGGMGVVFLAERTDFEKRVAIKMMRSNLPTDEQRYRFLSERNTLAKLDHPNIAQLLDAGFTSQQNPYFVMELVRGKSVLEFSNDGTLSVRERIELFKSILEAVAFAHQNLIVHRDIKPSNILVTEEGNVKLLDFGIAKILADENDAELTQSGVNLMTPAYASPEQVTRQSITTATDVYALGVLFYELLSGLKPYEFPTSSPLDVMKVICESEPKRPASALTRNLMTASTSLEQIASDRQTSPAKLKKLIDGDLESVVLKSLEKEPAKRYPNANAFLDDITRYLSGLPVEAQAPSWTYRTKKFLNRNKMATALGVASIIFLSTISILSVRFALKSNAQNLALLEAEALALSERDQARYERQNALESRELAERQRLRAEEQTIFAEHQKGLAEQGFYLAQLERDNALSEKETALGVTSILTDVLESVDPYLSLDDTLSESGLLSVSLQKLATFNGKDDIKSSLYSTIGGIYENMGEYNYAADLYSRAILSSNGDEDHFKLLSDQYYVLVEIGKFDEAREIFATAQNYCLESVRPNDPCTKQLGILNAYRQLISNNPKESVELYQQLLRDQIVDGHFTDKDLAEIYQGLSRGLTRIQRYDEALAQIDKAIDLVEEDFYGAQHAAFLGIKAEILSLKSSYAEAEKTHRIRLDIVERAVGKQHPKYAKGLHDLSIVLRYEAKYDEAIASLHAALTIINDTYGTDSERALDYMNQLAMNLVRKGDFDSAEGEYQKIINLRERRYSHQVRPLATAYHNMGLNYSKLGRYQDAVNILQKSIELKEGFADENNITLITSRQVLGFTFLKLGDYSKAEEFVDSACEDRQRMQGPDHAEYSRCIHLLADIYRRTDRSAEAISLYKRALEIRESRLRENHPLIGESLRMVSITNIDLEQYVEAYDYTLRLIDFDRYRKTQDPNFNFSGDLMRFGQILIQLRRYGEAEGILEESLRMQDDLGIRSGNTRDLIYHNLIELYRAKGDQAQADFYLTKLGQSSGQPSSSTN